ncbi:M16 family metallopeptidase [Alkalimonas amylolytica]|uniref:Predicted Zn-dependent peptidase n=1 Tax=Alkalimonas amylolytica TaxID=152573 RepID=A0A1H4B676_ALKAM|nr:M16 family metallopeptidase [Alkalimonas amylolytica]SEA43621.1 Predicted Zn-dependent peptidase [Alkalimonas amylolytica]
MQGKKGVVLFHPRRWLLAAKVGFGLVLAALLLTACAMTTEDAAHVLYDATTVVRLPATPERPEIIILPEHNSQFSNRARVMLLVGTGALQEEDDQLGLAHFVEHMAFRGTEKFPEQRMQEHMRELGIQLGRHSNAYTTFDHTAYWLDLQDLNRGQLESALTILAQWAYHIEFAPAAVQEEIAVIVEEWRLYQQEQDRIEPRLKEAFFRGSRHLDRLSILGDRASIEATTPEKLKTFYQQWYHPENMAIVVSGDVDAEQTLAFIKQKFTRLELASEPLLPEQFDIQPQAIPDVITLSDAYTPIAVLSRFWFAPIVPYNQSVERQEMALSFALGVLRKRLESRQLNSEGVVLAVNVQSRRQTANVNAFNMALLMTEPNYALAYELLEHELQRMLALGITEDEWQTERSNWQAWLQDAQDSPSDLVEMARDFWLYQEPIFNQRSHKQRQLELLELITPEEAIAALTQYSSGREVTVALYPHGTEAPSAEQLKGYQERAKQLPFAPLHQRAEPQWQPLAPSAGILSEQQQADGIIEWQLANGMTAYYRYSDAVPNRAFARLVARHGTNQVPDAQVAAARLASDLIRDGGQAGLNSAEIRQWRQSLDIGHNFSVDFDARSFYLAAPVSNIEQGLMELHHRLLHHRIDEELWRFNQGRELQLWQQFEEHPHLPWHQAQSKALWQNDIRYRNLMAAEIEATTVDQLQAFYQQWVQGNQGYQLALVGDLTAEQAYALVDRYFASLPKASPQGERRSSPQPLQASQQRISGSGEQHARISLRYYLDKTQLPSSLQQATAALLTSWLDEQLFDRIRTESGLTYSIRAQLGGFSPVHQQAVLHISLQTDPDKVDTAIAAVQQLLAAASKQAPSERQVEIWHQSLADARMQARQQPRWLANRIGYSALVEELPWARIAPLEQTATAEGLQQLLVNIVEQGHLVEMVWLP